MPKKLFPHVFIKDSHSAIGYISPRMGGGQNHIPLKNRKEQGRFLKKKFEGLWKEFEKTRGAVYFVEVSGVSVDFCSKAGYDLVTKSLEDLKAGIRILNIRREEKNGTETIFATVYIPRDKISIFLKKVGEYLAKDLKSGKPKNKNLIESIENVRLAVIESFWQDNKKLIPKTKDPVECEVWLRIDHNENKESVVNKFFAICDHFGITYIKDQNLSFPERVVLLICANKKQLEQIIKNSDRVAEFRRVQETARFWIDQENIDQIEWVKRFKETNSF